MVRRLARFLLGTLVLMASMAEASVVRRAAVDMGSGEYKLRVADVNTETRLVSYVTLSPEDSLRKVDGAVLLAASTNGLLPKAYTPLASKALSDLLKKGKSLGAKEYFVAATGIFRDARNGREVLRKIVANAGKELGKSKISARLLSGEEESRLGYLGAAAASQEKPEELLVLDIGGRTFQFAAQGEGGKIVFDSQSFGAIPFKQLVIEKVYGKESGRLTPNPLSDKALDEALAIAETIAAKIPPFVAAKLGRIGGRLVGIGGVLSRGIRGQMGGSPVYTRADLEAYLKTLREHPEDDAAIVKRTGTKYPETEVTNVLLVIGLARYLKIDSFRVFDVNIADGLLLGANEPR